LSAWKVWKYENPDFPKEILKEAAQNDAGALVFREGTKTP
jgi:hypothetical protein